VISTVDPALVRRLPRIWLPANAQVEVGQVLPDGAGGTDARALGVLSLAGLASNISWVRVKDGQLTAGLRDRLELRFVPPVDLPVKAAIAIAVVKTLSSPATGGPTYLDVSVLERPVAGGDTQPAG